MSRHPTPVDQDVTPVEMAFASPRNQPRSVMVHGLKRTIFVLALGWVATVSCAAELVGRVVGVLDGDTIDVLTPAKIQVRIRLAGIDAPEKRQAFGNAAKQKLSDLVFARQVTVDWTKTDRYKRTIGKVLVNGVDANLRMVETGMAWHYKQYAKEQSPADRRLYAAAEEGARARRVGLWRDASPVAPWTFRRPNAKS